jgi:hypothetical protein
MLGQRVQKIIPPHDWVIRYVPEAPPPVLTQGIPRFVMALLIPAQQMVDN